MKLAIVGAEEHTREEAPWDDPNFDILIFNEYSTADWCKRWDILLQIHPKLVYQNPNNDKDREYWPWLQEKHGKPIYMQEVDSLVPDSVKYPLEEINKEFLTTLTYEGTPVKNFFATIGYAVALGIYLGYEEIDVYGVELVYDLQYRSQQPNYAFWVGVATGRKIPVNLHCSRGTFDQPLYGYEVYMTYPNKLEEYIKGMKEQKSATLEQLYKIEGAIQFAQQLLDEERKEEESKKELEKVGTDGAQSEQVTTRPI
jgi:hypothetical protein